MHQTFVIHLRIELVIFCLSSAVSNWYFGNPRWKHWEEKMKVTVATKHILKIAVQAFRFVTLK